MSQHEDPILLARAREMRANSTKEERRLWYDFLTKLPVKFYRQKIIKPYIVDFCCPSKKLVVELDGAQHYEENAVIYDERRNDFLASLGYTVLRYSNYDFSRNFNGVCEDIYNHLNLPV